MDPQQHAVGEQALDISASPRGLSCVVPHLNKSVVDARAVRHEEAGAGGHAVEEEELLLRADVAVVPLLGLLHSVLVVLHRGRVGEGDAVHPLQRTSSLADSPTQCAQPERLPRLALPNL